jgi:hypothetical protein
MVHYGGNSIIKETVQKSKSVQAKAESITTSLMPSFLINSASFEYTVAFRIDPRMRCTTNPSVKHRIYMHEKSIHTGSMQADKKYEKRKREPAEWLALRQNTPVTSRNPSSRPGRSNTRRGGRVKSPACPPVRKVKSPKRNKKRPRRSLSDQQPIRAITAALAATFLNLALPQK